MRPLLRDGPNFMISYSHADTSRVDGIVSAIEEEGIRYFKDEKHTEFDEPILERIIRAIWDASHVLIYLSRASRESRWVYAEYCIARALDRKVVLINFEGVDGLPPAFGARRGLTSEKQLAEFLASTRKEELFPHMSPPARAARSGLYFYPGGYVEAIRLYGVEKEIVPPDMLLVDYTRTPYHPPPFYLERFHYEITRRVEEAKRSGKNFFDGPNVRLIRMRANPRDDNRVGLERKALELELGPVGWYHYEGVNSVMREEFRRGSPEDAMQGWLGLDSLLNGGDMPSRF